MSVSQPVNLAAATLAAHTDAENPHSGHEQTANKDQPNGYPVYDAQKRIENTGKVWTAADATEMVALSTAQPGDYCARTDEGLLRRLRVGGMYSTAADWRKVVETNVDDHLSAVVIHRYGTAAEVDAISLAQGEIALCTDTMEIRKGDGATLGGIGEGGGMNAKVAARCEPTADGWVADHQNMPLLIIEGRIDATVGQEFDEVWNGSLADGTYEGQLLNVLLRAAITKEDENDSIELRVTVQLNSLGEAYDAFADGRVGIPIIPSPFNRSYATPNFRAGQVLFTLQWCGGQWNRLDAAGTANLITGRNATAVGYGNRATGNNSFAGGSASTASGVSAFAFGGGASASASGAVAIGYTAKAENTEAIALGRFARASGFCAVALGDGAVASGDRAVALGYGANATAEEAFALAGNSVAGKGAAAVGRWNEIPATAPESFVAGMGAKPRQPGQVATGLAIGDYGDCQKTTDHLGLTTSDASPTVATIYTWDNDTGHLDISGACVWQFIIQVAAINRTGGDGAAYFIRGAVRRTEAGTVALLGSPTIETWEDASMAACDVSVTADDTNKRLAITVTGLAGTDVKWAVIPTMAQVWEH